MVFLVKVAAQNSFFDVASLVQNAFEVFHVLVVASFLFFGDGLEVHVFPQFFFLEFLSFLLEFFEFELLLHDLVEVVEPNCFD